jgi:hypothetical protein
MVEKQVAQKNEGFFKKLTYILIYLVTKFG